MPFITVKRALHLPDLVRLGRYRKAPELGPRVLFFSGGTALTALSRNLKEYTHNSIHLVTPFDSGGSSAKLRESFSMPSIGDLRSRMMALADENITGHPEVYRLFTYRLPSDRDPDQLRSMLNDMIRSEDPRVAAIPNPMRRLVRNQLGFFREAIPAGFDLRGASTGNLILAGGYLNNHQHLDPIIYLFSQLVGVKGTVRTILNADLHLAAVLEDGSIITGQHRITGKEAEPLAQPIARLALSRFRDRFEPVAVRLRKKVRQLISSAELICYPPGSFYSSLIANLLPGGVGKAIAANPAPKVYLPNLGSDPEQRGMSLDRSVSTLVDCLQEDAGILPTAAGLLDFVLLDSDQEHYASRLSPELLDKLGVQLLRAPLISADSAPYYDAQRVNAALLSLT